MRLLKYFSSIITILTVVQSTNASDQDDRPVERGLQDLAQRWNIQEPTFEYERLQFSLNWKVSDFIEDRFMDYRVYDGFGCKEESYDITESSNNQANGNIYLLTPGIIPSALTPHNSGPTSGSGERSIHLRFSIQSENIAKSPIFTDDASQAQARAEVRFCVRYSLWNDYKELENSVEVNFQETLIYLEIDLTDGFEVGEIQVADAEKGIETANIACEVIGYECYENNTAIVDPGYLRNQGSETRICVTTTEESKTNGLYLNRINWFYFYRVNPEGIVRQNAIIYDSISAPNGLTNYNCQPAEDPCGFDTILFAQFYDRSGVGIVLGLGEATCQFGTSGFNNDQIEIPQIPRTTAAPVASPSTTPSPVEELSTPAPVARAPATAPTTAAPAFQPAVTPAPLFQPTTAAPQSETVDQQPTTTAAPGSAPTTTGAPQFSPHQPDYPDAGAYPTPAPCNHPLCSNCGTEAEVFYESNDEVPFPPGAIVIDDQAADGTSVTFTITQLWKNDDSISWIAILYPDHTEGNNVCPKFESVGYLDSFQHTATCYDHTTSNVYVYIEIYVHDGSFGPHSDAYVPEGCEPSQDLGRKVAYEVWIPCSPCERRLSENMILSAPLVGMQGGAQTKKNEIPQLFLPGPSSSSSSPKDYDFSSLSKSAHSGRIAKSMLDRQRQRKLQDTIPPSPFELEFAIFSDGRGTSSSSAPVARVLFGVAVSFITSAALSILFD